MASKLSSSSRSPKRPTHPQEEEEVGHSAPNELPPLVSDDRDGQAESVELKQFRAQWRSELKRARTDQDDQPGSSKTDCSASAAGKRVAPGSTKYATDEWKRQKEEERKNALLLSREEAEPLSFSVSLDEPLLILPLTTVERLHISMIPDEVLVYLLCFLDEVALVRLSLVCKKSYCLSREPVLWRLICKRIWAHNCTRQVYMKYGTWQRMFLTRPTVRTDGIFVSKNTYLRPGSTEWAYHQPIHQVIYYRYLRLLPDGKLIYAMALDVPRKALKWFNLRTLEQHEKEKIRERVPASQSHTSCYPSPGTYRLDDVLGSFDMWVQGKTMTQSFNCILRRKQGGRYINIGVNKYFSTSKSGVITEYDSVRVVPFRFYKLPAHILDPAEEQVPQQQ